MRRVYENKDWCRGYETAVVGRYVMYNWIKVFGEIDRVCVLDFMVHCSKGYAMEILAGVWPE